MISSKKLDQLRATRSFGIGRLFLLARRDFSARLAQKMAARHPDGGPHPGGPHPGGPNPGGPNPGGPILGGSLLPFLDLEGTRSTELARRAGITKQAVAKVLKELEEAGLVTRTQDQSDGRAQLVHFTESGVDYLLQIHAAIRSIELEYEQMLGAAQLQQLRASLSQLVYPPGKAP